jgi:hypothetical protein
VISIGTYLRDTSNVLIDGALDVIGTIFIPPEFRTCSVNRDDNQQAIYLFYQADKYLTIYNIKIAAFNISTVIIIVRLAFLALNLTPLTATLAGSTLLLLGLRIVLKHNIENSLPYKTSEIANFVGKWLNLDKLDFGGRDCLGFFKTFTPKDRFTDTRSLRNNQDLFQ